MIQIIYSKMECELSGSNDELQRLSEQITDFCQSNDKLLFLKTETQLDPSPYDEVLTSIVLEKTDDMFVASKRDDTLYITGGIESLTNFVQNLPYDAEMSNNGVSFHVHFDALGWPEHISAESIEMVLSLKHGRSG
ncbi:hypothetical protein [Chitinibacter sp. S2-10]|uniref:hypothetical protein n=1 Tax=Chitinibacter sp. S2-10 TaxID=3373597 RepID=UPI003977CDFD